MKTNSYLLFAGCLCLAGSWLLASSACATELPPQIILIGNGQVITNGSPRPTLTNHTHFGSTIADIRTFTITNAGFGPLILTGTPLVTVSGANADRFAVTSPPDALVSPGSSTTFQVTFTPDGFGVRTAELGIFQ